VQWFEKSADQGCSNAQHSLGNMYLHGRGVAHNLAEAVRYYKLSANKGFAPAQFSLGYSFEMGRGVAQSDKAAVQWYRKAADQGLQKHRVVLGIFLKMAAAFHKVMPRRQSGTESQPTKDMALRS